MRGGEAVAGLAARAGADGCGVEGLTAELAEQCRWKAGGIGAVPLDDDGQGVGGNVAGAADAPGLAGGLDGGDAAGVEADGDAAFDGAGGKAGDGAGEVLHGEEEAAGGEDADADGVEAPVEEIAAVDGCAHPHAFDLGGRLGVAGEVFGDCGEGGAGEGGAVDKRWLAGKLVGELAVFGKGALGMETGGAGEGGVPGKGSEAVLGSIGVGEVEELQLLRGRGRGGRGLRVK